jgi:N-methylhydantoinase B
MNKIANATALDPVLMAVLANRVDGIVREMTNTLLKTARSAVINSARDLSCAIVTSDNELFACAEALPIHIFGADKQTRVMCESHPDLAEGDCYRRLIRLTAAIAYRRLIWRLRRMSTKRAR